MNVRDFDQKSKEISPTRKPVDEIRVDCFAAEDFVSFGIR